MFINFVHGTWNLSAVPSQPFTAAVAGTSNIQIQLAIAEAAKKLCQPPLVLIICPRCTYKKVMAEPLRETADIQYNLKFICPQCLRHDGVAMVMRGENK